jgi:RNA polymerase sigma-70 factor (ECF subfamily)
MSELNNGSGRIALEDFQAYLHVLAMSTLADLEPPLKGKITASDIVQDTLLRAHQKLDQLQGTTRPEVAGWLKKILKTIVSNRIRDLFRKKRGLGREKSLEDLLERSAVSLDVFANSSASSPSNKASRKEDVLRLAEALERLPEDQREVVILHHCRDWDVLHVAQHLGRTPRSVAGLLRRGREALRKDLDGRG